MTKKSSTKKALLSSAISLLLCFSMLLSTTFAWFTDSVTSANNIIKSGNLDIELYHANNGTAGADVVVDNTTKLFTDVDSGNWEPGAMAWEKLTVENTGSLELKYKLTLNALNATEVGGVSFADMLKVSLIKDESFVYNRDNVADLTEWDTLKSFTLEGELAPTETATYGVVIWWEPSAQDNLFNMNNGNAGETVSVEVGVNLFATQATAESDSFGPDYDEAAPVVTVKVTPANVQEYLNGQHGNLTNMKLVLTAGEYGVLNIGVPTKYEGSNTEMYCETHDATFTKAEEFKAHLADGQYHTTPRYTVSINNLTVVGEEGAEVAGVVISSGHYYGVGSDLVLDKTYTAGSIYYLTNEITDLSFENVAFTGGVNINTSEPTTVISGVSFSNCSFTTSGVVSVAATSDTTPALRFYNEAQNGRVNGLTVDGCNFYDCYQGVYTQNTEDITVVNSTFKNTEHNAIAIQDHGDACDHGKVVIVSNVFTDIKDRVVRFNNIGADTQVEMKYNVATNSGDEDKQVIKATSVAAGASFDVDYNVWGEGAVIANDQFKNKVTGTVTSATTSAELNKAENKSEDVTIVIPSDTVITGTTGLDLGGATVIGGNFKNESGYAVSGTVDGIFKNCVFDSSEALRWCYSDVGTTVVFENCVFKTDFRGFHFDDMKGDVIFRNCEINGFNAYGGDGTATFEGCTFGYDESSYCGLNSYSNTVIKNCTFNFKSGKTNFVDMEETGKTIEISGCVAYLDGVETDLLNFVGGSKLPGCTLIVDGVTVTK